MMRLIKHKYPRVSLVEKRNQMRLIQATHLDEIGIGLPAPASMLNRNN